MRIAILSDIHSNLQALTKAFSLIDRSRIDEVHCLGDIVGYGANPNECIDMIRDRAKYSVLGNKQLTQLNRNFLSSLPYRIQTDTFMLAHASPHEPANWEYVLSLPVAQKQFAAFSTQICFIGHTHVPSVCGENLRTFTFKKDMRFLINVGSVGQPRDGSPQLSFGIFDTASWTYQNIRADYDVKSASKAILNSGLPSTLAKRLFQGQ
jgi:predicted phosphodiesterase